MAMPGRRWRNLSWKGLPEKPRFRVFLFPPAHKKIPENELPEEEEKISMA